MKGFRWERDCPKVLNRSLVKKLAELAPDGIGRWIERLQREILLLGPEYDDAIQQCAKIAGEDFKYADQALRLTFVTLRDLKKGIQQVIHEIKQNMIGQGNYQTVKGVADQLGQTRQKLSVEILRDLEVVRGALRAKQRVLNHFSIAFMGQAKAGKSTLHAVVTGEGWEAIDIGKQRIRK